MNNDALKTSCMAAWRHRLRCATTLGILSIAASTGSASPIGSAVTATLSGGNGSWAVTTPFATSAVVGAGVEFTAAMSGPFGTKWSFAVDLDSTGFWFDFNPTSALSGPITCPNYCFGIDLGELDGYGLITGLDITSGDAGLINYKALTADSVSIRVNPTGSGNQRFRFDFAASQVPEPTTLALVGIAVFGLVLGSSRKAKSSP